jgi:hypothetical protein
MFGMGGKGAPAARQDKPRTAKKPAMVSVTVKLEPHQRDKLALLGGEAWVREQIDKAKFESVFTA